jgi:hypothetical protein
MFEPVVLSSWDRAHETKITIANFILRQNEISICYTMHLNKIWILFKSNSRVKY